MEVGLGVLMGTKLNMSLRGVPAVWNATDISAALEVLASKQDVPSPLLSTGEVSSEVLHSSLGCPGED